MSRAKKIRKAVKLALAKQSNGSNTNSERNEDREEIESAHPTYVASKLGLLLRYKLTYRSVGPKSMARFARRRGIGANLIKDLF